MYQIMILEEVSSCIPRLNIALINNVSSLTSFENSDPHELMSANDIFSSTWIYPEITAI